LRESLKGAWRAEASVGGADDGTAFAIVALWYWIVGLPVPPPGGQEPGHTDT
jgi:hypothetical protein